jgi:hypothetical protein
MHSAFQYDQYLVKKQAIALTGKIRIYAPDGSLKLFSEQKMFKLREDIRVFSDESKTVEILAIKARQIIDFSAAYDVVDAAEGKVGALRRKGLRSLLRDEWEVLDNQDQVIAIITEDSVGLAVLRRLVLGSLLPQNYDMLIGSDRVVDLKQRFNLFRYEMDVDFTMDAGHRVDRRIGLAAAILLAIVEGKQSS